MTDVRNIAEKRWEKMCESEEGPTIDDLLEVALAKRRDGEFKGAKQCIVIMAGDEGVGLNIMCAGEMDNFGRLGLIDVAHSCFRDNLIFDI